ncbi:hypothetical protein QR685DRAFT_572642 [Neurospora intermedia]|uniref:FAD-dependent oxidoreductase-like enzyme n=1 Tax=Neurospora intermedia TaxID=5142 RepID=A0ABR3DAH4_NEUIN
MYRRGGSTQQCQHRPSKTLVEPARALFTTIEPTDNQRLLDRQSPASPPLIALLVHPSKFQSNSHTSSRIWRNRHKGALDRSPRRDQSDDPNSSTAEIHILTRTEADIGQPTETMSTTDTEESQLQPAQLLVDAMSNDRRFGLIQDPALISEDDDMRNPSSPETIPSTQVADTPDEVDNGPSGFRLRVNEEGPVDTIIPSSVTPPPSSQMPNAAGTGAATSLAFASSQRSGYFSPPATTVIFGSKREANTALEFNPPASQEIADASIDKLRSMLQTCIAENAKLKMETAHHKLQYNLLSLQADEDMKRAAVEHEMTRREVEALRVAEHTRQARRDLDAASETQQTKFMQLKTLYDQRVEEVDFLNRKLKAARKIIQQKEDENISLCDERELLLNRIRENREHFQILCSPGGMFHGATIGRQTVAVTAPSQPQHHTPPRPTPRTVYREAQARVDKDHSKGNFTMLLQAIDQENTSAPSTPRGLSHSAARHTRNAQSMSSLPTTPTQCLRGETGGLLPSVDLVPQTEPPYRHNRYVPETPVRSATRDRRRSRESTISAEDNEELARQALQSVAAASFASRSSQHQLGPMQRNPTNEEEEGAFESQASQAATQMLRRDPRESFEVASSVEHLRNGTPAPADKTAKLQAKLFGGLNKSGVSSGEKRKFAGHGDPIEEFSLRDRLSPTKKLRTVGGLRDPSKVGLGIQYSQDA